MVTKNTRIIDITVGDFLEFLKQTQDVDPPKNYTAPSNEKYVYGLSGIATLFGCSKRAASNLKASGKIDKAIIQEGRKIVVDANLALDLIKKHR